MRYAIPDLIARERRIKCWIICDDHNEPFHGIYSTKEEAMVDKDEWEFPGAKPIEAEIILKK